MKIESLSPKKQKYVKARASGMTKKEAALSAGYAESTALRVANNIETPDVRAAFAELMRLKCPAEKIARRVAEGMDATENALCSVNGEVSQSAIVSWSERRHYTRLAAEFAGYFVPPKQAEVAGPQILIQINRDVETPQIQVSQAPQV
jgi:hypothetical protein